MQGDAATVTGAFRRVAIGGEEHAVAPVTLRMLGDLQAWVDAQFVDPFAIVNEQVGKGGYNTAQQQYLYRVAMDLARQPKPMIGTPEADELLRSYAGFREILFRCVGKAEPGFTRGDAERLYDAMGPAELIRLLVLVNLDMVMSDPKADGGATAGDGPPTGGGSSTPPP
jgi:hypothetical protein